MTDEQIKEIKEQIRKGFQKVENIQEKYDELREKYKNKEQEYVRLSHLIRKTKTYLNVCEECADEILIYPSISGRTEYTDIEVEEESLKKIIRQLDQLKAENEELKKVSCKFKNYCTCDTEKLKQILTEIKELCKRQDLNQGSRCIHILQKISEVEDD